MSWSYSYNPDIWPALVTLALATYLGQYSWRRRHLPGATAFAVACALGSVWILGVILELSAVGSATQVFWRKFQAVWQLPVGAAVTCFILQFAGLGRFLRLRTYALLFLVPALSTVAIATNGFHHLVWTGFEMSAHVVLSPGPLLWFFNSYIYLLGLVNLVVLVWLAIRSPGHRWPVAIIVCGQVVARIGYTIDTIDDGWLGPGESILFTVGVASAAYAIAFLRFHVIDPVAAARTAVLEQMREGVFVLDLEGRIVDVNPEGAAIVGVPEAELRNRPAAEVLPVDAGTPGGSDDGAMDRADIVLGGPGRARHYDLRVTPLRGRGSEPIGQLLLLHDVTEQKQAQARILQQQRVLATLQERERLARELHDGIGQVLGYVGLQAQAALQWTRSGNRGKAASILGRLQEVANEAHADVRESILSLKADSLQGWLFVPTLRKYLERFQTHYGIRTELSISDGLGEDALEPAVGLQLLRVVQEALSNSRKHSAARSLNVTVEANGSRVHITITDDGQGFDTSRLEGEDGRHFGLVFMRERMDQIGGAMTIDSAPGCGTVVRLDVPTREQGGLGEGASG
jgi:signal transduction histidine kinase